MKYSIKYVFFLLTLTTGLYAQNGTVEAVNGVIIGNNSGTEAGTVRWTGTDFEGYDGTAWISLTSNGAIASLLEDADGDTRIDLEGGGIGDNDIIFLEAGGTDVGMIDAKNKLFLGGNSGNKFGEDSGSTGIGYRTMKSIDKGFANSAFGYQAMENIDSGSYNLALGYDVMSDFGEGSFNFAAGSFSLQELTSGDRNVALGYGAMQDADSSISNVAIGTSALKEVEGNFNIAVGESALKRIDEANHNVAIGYLAGHYVDGSSTRNVLIGNLAGRGGSIGSEHEKKSNVMIGYGSGQFNKGNKNVFLGTYAGELNHGDGSVCIGFDAGRKDSLNNRLFIENSSADSSGALIYGQFDNDFLRFNADVLIKNGVTIGNSASTVAGTLRWTGTDFELFDGVNWVSLTEAPSLLSDNDGDTRIDLEGVGDHDEVRMIANNSVVARIGYTSNLSLGRFSIPITSAADQNTAVGFGTMRYNGTGEKNTAFGYNALNNNQSGSNNAAFGMDAGAKDDDFSSHNVYLGSGAGNHSSLTPFQKDRNVMIGYQAGYDVSTSGNIMIGYQAGKGETMGDRLYIANDDSDKENALIYGEFNNDFLRINGRMHMYDNSGSSSAQLQLTEYGADGARIIMDNDQNDNYWTIFGRPYTSSGSSQINFHYSDISGSGSQTGNKFRIYGDGDAFLYHSSNGSTGAGLRLLNGDNNSQYWRLYTAEGSGDLRFYSDDNTSNARAWINDATGAYTSASDVRLKKNIMNLTTLLEKVLLLSPKSYKYNCQKGQEVNSLGFLAQEAIALFPELVDYQEGADQYGINYAGFSVVAIKAIQEQQEIIENLSDKLDQAASSNNALEKRLDEQEKQINALIAQLK